MTETNTTPTPPPNEVVNRVFKDYIEPLAVAQDLKNIGAPTEWWENELVDLLSDYHLGLNSSFDIRDFIHKTITQALAEQKARMVEVTEGMRQKDEFGWKDRPFYGTVAARAHVISYNQAIDDIIKNLKGGE